GGGGWGGGGGGGGGGGRGGGGGGGGRGGGRVADTLTTLGSGFSASKPSASRQPWRTSTARSRSARETVKVRSVLPSAEIFCTIMSTLIALSASGPKIAAATPGRSATRWTVIFASSRPQAMPLTI